MRSAIWLAASEIMRAGGNLRDHIAAEEIRLLVITARWQEGWPKQVNDIALDCHHLLTLRIGPVELIRCDTVRAAGVNLITLASMESQ